MNLPSPLLHSAPLHTGTVCRVCVLCKSVNSLRQCPEQTGLQIGLLIKGGRKFSLEHCVSKTEGKEAKPHGSAHTFSNSTQPGLHQETAT